MSRLRRSTVVRIIGAILFRVILYLNFFMLLKLFKKRVLLLRAKRLLIRRACRTRWVPRLPRTRLIIISVKVVLRDSLLVGEGRTIRSTIVTKKLTLGDLKILLAVVTCLILLIYMRLSPLPTCRDTGLNELVPMALDLTRVLCLFDRKASLFTIIYPRMCHALIRRLVTLSLLRNSGIREIPVGVLVSPLRYLLNGMTGLVILFVFLGPKMRMVVLTMDVLARRRRLCDRVD